MDADGGGGGLGALVYQSLNDDSYRWENAFCFCRNQPIELNYSFIKLLYLISIIN